MEQPEPTLGDWWLDLAQDATDRDPSATFWPDGSSHPQPTPSTTAGLPDLSVKAVLGEGGMGVVHLAVQHSLDREVALKRAHSTDAGAAGLLLREARIMGRLEHPNVVPVHALDHDEQGRPGLVMKRVQGVSWRTLLDEPDHPAWKRRLPLTDDPLARHVHILLDVCNALGFAHSRGVVHRDLKPDNVMVGEFGEVYLMDWGIAAEIGETLLPSQGLLGTPAYMPPELLQRPSVTAPTVDIYLLGACLHELLVGAPLHGHGSLEEVLERAAQSASYAYPPSVPAPLADLCARACAPDPAERPASVDDFREALTGWLRWTGAQQLLDTASARVGQLRQLTAASAPDPSEVQQVFLAGRAVLKELQSSRADDPQVRHLQIEILQLKAHFDLAHGDLTGARALIAELKELGAESGMLSQHLARYERQVDRLRRLSWDLDYSIAAGARTALVLAFVVLLVSLVGISVGRRLTGHTDSIIIGYPLVFVIASTSITPLVWPWLRRNRVNRQAAGAVNIMTWSWLLQRIVLKPALHPDLIMLTDLCLFATWMAMLGVFIRPWLAAPVPILVAGAIAVTWLVEDVHLTYLIVVLTGLAVWVGAWAWAFTRRPSAEPG